MVCLLLVCGRAGRATTSHRTRDGQRRGTEGLFHHGGRRQRREPAPLSEIRACAEEGQPARLPAEEGEPPPCQGYCPVQQRSTSMSGGNGPTSTTRRHSP